LYSVITPLLEPLTDATPAVNVIDVAVPSVRAVPPVSLTVGT
jgi:hypothetical protein